MKMPYYSNAILIALQSRPWLIYSKTIGSLNCIMHQPQQWSAQIHKTIEVHFEKYTKLQHSTQPQMDGHISKVDLELGLLLNSKDGAGIATPYNPSIKPLDFLEVAPRAKSSKS